MSFVICPREDCPLEFMRRAINATLANSKAPRGSSEQCMSCNLCQQTKCWKRDAQGREKAYTASSA